MSLRAIPNTDTKNNDERKNMKRKIVFTLSLLLTLVIGTGLLTMFFHTSGEQNEETVTNNHEEGKRNQVTCSVLNGDTLVISGEGELKLEVLSYAFDEKEWDKIQKVRIDEGITKLGSRCFQNTAEDDYRIKEIFIADSVKEIDSECFSGLDELTSLNMGKGVQVIGDGAFSSCRKLKNIAFSNALKEIGEYAFSDCESLFQIRLPASTETIQYRAFEGCSNLEEIILSENLKNWIKPGEGCPALKKVTNLSKKVWKLPTCKNRKRWFVTGRRKGKVLPGEVALAQGKRYAIQYRLDGGRLVGKVPGSYEYGKVQPIAATVEKKGYYCIGWYKDMKESGEAGMFLFIPEPILQRDVSGDLLLRPLFVKYQVANVSKQAVRIVLSDAGSPYVQDYFEIRYSLNKNMSDAKTVLISEKDTVVVKNLEKGKRYYFEFRWGTSEGNDDDNEPLQPESPWLGKQSVLISQ